MSQCVGELSLNTSVIENTKYTLYLILRYMLQTVFGLL